MNTLAKDEQPIHQEEETSDQQKMVKMSSLLRKTDGLGGAH
jgi:hypothetical protein